MKERKQAPAPLPHQDIGTAFLRDRDSAALFDEQGLGKSRQLIDAICLDVRQDALDAALIVCPNGLKANWAEEVEKYSEERYAVFGSGRKARRVAFQSLKAVFYVINYEAVAAELPSLRALLRFKRIALVLDESHRIKTPTARVTTAIHALRTDAAKRYILTGTPVANKPEDLWSQFFFLDGGASLGTSPDEFNQRFGNGSGGYSRLEELRERFAAISLRREKSTSVDLPPKTYINIPVYLRDEQARMYEELRSSLELCIRDLSGAEILAIADNILTRLIRLAQLASNPALLDAAYLETPAKFVALDQLLDHYLAEPSEKVIVWTSFVGNIAALATRLARFNPVVIHGEINNEERTRAVRAFKTDPQVRILLANPAAAREGLTLTEARTAVYLDRTFNLVDFLQSQDRIHRLSQTKPCEIVLLIADHTIDEFIDFAIEQKHRLARFSQGDTDDITAEDLALEKPALLKALVGTPHS